MTPKHPLTTQHVKPLAYGKAMLIGFGIALLAICTFVFGVDNPRPEWGEYWRVRPLLVTPLAGACGGAFFSFMHRLNLQGGWKLLAVTIGMMGFVVSLWLGIVLGLAGTMWN